MIDFHSHILPAIDDGARNVDVSDRMLAMSEVQGVEKIIATPHFYADEMSVQGFLERRQLAFETVKEKRKSDKPAVFLGAEVAFFSRMSKADRLDDLTINHSRVLLLEMPFHDWSLDDLKEVVSLIKERGFLIILAHLERYMRRSNLRMVERLMRTDARVQINAESLADRRMKRQLLKLFRQGKAHFLGSDCHGIHHRPPNLEVGRAVLLESLGEDFLKRLDEDNRLFFEEKICQNGQASS